MKRLILAVLLLACVGSAWGAQNTPTAIAYEVKVYTQADVLGTRESADLPKPIATLLPYMSFMYSGTGVTITTRVNGSIAKLVQTKNVPKYKVTIISVKPIPTPTMTATYVVK